MSDYTFDEDDESLDPEGCFDFPGLVATAYANWQLLSGAIAPTQHMCLAVSHLVRCLPKYIEDTVDPPLIESLHVLRDSMLQARDALSLAGHANEELKVCFEDLARGFAAARAIHERAAVVGFGRA